MNPKSLVGIIDYSFGRVVLYKIVKVHYVEALPEGTTLYSLYEIGHKTEAKFETIRAQQRGLILKDSKVSKGDCKIEEEMPAVHYGLFDIIDQFGDLWTIDGVAAIQNLGGDVMWYRPGFGLIVLCNYRLYVEARKEHGLPPLSKIEYIAAIKDKKLIFNDTVPVKATLKQRRPRKRKRDEWLDDDWY